MLNRIKDAPTLEESYPEAGIFQTLRTAAASSHEWAENTTEAEAGILDNYFLDQFYFRKLNRFGQKISTDLEYVINSLILIHGVEWDRLYTDYTAEYNPIWNVDGSTTETETRDLTKTQTGTGDFTDSGTDTTTRTGTDTTAYTGTDTDTATESIQGFNSTTYSPESQNIEKIEKGTADTVTHDTQDSLVHGKKTAETRNYTDTDTGTITRTETRGGNIGVTMTQQMLEADRAYWTNCLSQFYKIVCSDIIGEISYKIYTDEETGATST